MSDSSLSLCVSYAVEMTGEQVQPTPALRFKAGVLQQLFEIVTYRESRPVERRVEWRDVPTED